MKQFLAFFFTLSLVTFLSPHADSTVIKILAPEEILAQKEVIFKGEFVEQFYKDNEKKEYEDLYATFKVLDVVKGDVPKNVTIFIRTLRKEEFKNQSKSQSDMPQFVESYGRKPTDDRNLFSDGGVFYVYGRYQRDETSILRDKHNHYQIQYTGRKHNEKLAEDIKAVFDSYTERKNIYDTLYLEAENADILLQKADYLISKKDYAGAKSIYEKILQSFYSENNIDIHDKEKWVETYCSGPSAYQNFHKDFLKHPSKIFIRKIDFGYFQPSLATPDLNAHILSLYGRMLYYLRDYKASLRPLCLSARTFDALKYKTLTLLKLGHKEMAITDPFNRLDDTPVLDLSNLELGERYIGEIDLSDINVTNANFSGSSFYGINVKNAVLKNADFSNTEINKVFGEKANLSNANFVYADASLNLKNSILNNLDGQYAKLNNRLESTELNGAKFSHAELSVSFKNSNLENADFSNTILKSIFNGANLKNAIFDKTTFYPSTYDCNTIFPKGFNPNSHEHLETKGFCLPKAKKGEKLELEDFLNPHKTHYRFLNFENIAEITETIGFESTRACGWGDWSHRYKKRKKKWEKKDLTGIDLSGCDLNYNEFNDANLSKANLSGTYLYSTDLSKANIEDANFFAARLTSSTKLPENFNLHDHKFIETHIQNSGQSPYQASEMAEQHGRYSPQHNRRRRPYSIDVPDLSKADLDEFILNGSWLPEVNLKKASLKLANLRASNLMCANLKDANLTGAILYDALLDKADLTNANLYGADLRWARMNETILDNANLKNVIYNQYTVWPEDFVPSKHGAFFIKEKEPFGPIPNLTLNDDQYITCDLPHYQRRMQRNTTNTKNTENSNIKFHIRKDSIISYQDVPSGIKVKLSELANKTLSNNTFIPGGLRIDLYFEDILIHSPQSELPKNNELLFHVKGDKKEEILKILSRSKSHISQDQDPFRKWRER